MSPTGTTRTCRDVCYLAAFGGKADVKKAGSTTHAVWLGREYIARLTGDRSSGTPARQLYQRAPGAVFAVHRSFCRRVGPASGREAKKILRGGISNAAEANVHVNE